MHPRASFVFFLPCLLAVSACHVMAQTAPPEPAQQLVADVIYNELHDRECDSFWEYRSVRVSGNQNVVREQVETAEGPIFRVIEDHGSPLTAEQREREDRGAESPCGWA